MEYDVIKRTLKDKVSLTIIILFGLLLFGCGFMSLVIYQGTTRTQKFFYNEPIASTIKQVNDQYEINNRLNKIVNSNSYTLKDAYIELNPYGISPLSGIIIFQTREEEQIRVYINGEYFTTMEPTKKHVIPIYGLYEDYDNVIRVEGTNETQEYIIKTENSNINFPVNDKNIEYKDELVFISADRITGWDKNKRLRFYLTSNNNNDIDFLSNGHFVVGICEGGFNNNYIGIVEMDYLGKIYNYYALPNGYAHELQVLSNGNILLSGGKDTIYSNKPIIYEIDPRTGNTVNEINVDSIVGNIYSGVLTIDDFRYNESNKELTISFKDIDKNFVLTNNSSNWINKTTISNRVVIDNKLYRLYNNHLYGEVTANTNINYIKEFNKIEKDNLTESSYRKIDLDQSVNYNNKVEFTRNTFITDYDIKNEDEIKIYLVNKAGKIYILDYKEKDSEIKGRVFNLNLPVGQYALFIKINNTLYRTDLVYQF